MNVRKTIFAVGGSAVIVVLLGIRFGWFEKQKTQTEVKKTAVVQTVKKSAPAAKKVQNTPKAVPVVKKKTETAVKTEKVSEEEKSLGVGDPFAYANSSSGDYTPMSGTKNVGAITVKGIIRIEGEAPKAILHLKDSDRVHYVSKDSVVRVSTKSAKGSSPAEAYIVVKDIRNDEVELIQLERPDKVIIIR